MNCKMFSKEMLVEENVVYSPNSVSFFAWAPNRMWTEIIRTTFSPGLGKKPSMQILWDFPLCLATECKKGRPSPEGDTVKGSWILQWMQEQRQTSHTSTRLAGADLSKKCKYVCMLRDWIWGELLKQWVYSD